MSTAWCTHPIFDVKKGESIEPWIEQLELLLDADGITQDVRRKAALLAKLPDECRKYVKSSDDEVTNTFQQIKTLLQEKYDGSISIQSAQQRLKSFKVDIDEAKFFRSCMELGKLLSIIYRKLDDEQLLDLQLNYLQGKLTFNDSLWNKMNTRPAYNSYQECIRDLESTLKITNDRNRSKKKNNERNNRNYQRFNENRSEQRNENDRRFNNPSRQNTSNARNARVAENLQTVDETITNQQMRIMEDRIGRLHENTNNQMYTVEHLTEQIQLLKRNLYTIKDNKNVTRVAKVREEDEGTVQITKNSSKLLNKSGGNQVGFDEHLAYTAKNSHDFYIPVKFPDNVTTIALIDGGATRGVIRESRANALGFRKEVSINKRVCTLANGSIWPTLGLLKTKISLTNNVSVNLIFHVVSDTELKDPNYSVILGSDFLTITNTLLDYGRKIVEIANRPILTINLNSYNNSSPNLIRSIYDENNVIIKKFENEIKDKYYQVFAKDREDIGTCLIKAPPLRLLTNEISSTPRYPIPYYRRQLVHDQVQSWLKSGVIERSNDVKYICNLVFVTNKNKTQRVCLDCRPLNKNLALWDYKCPTINEKIHILSGAQFFTKFDMSQYFLQIQLQEDDRSLVGFKDENGLLFRCIKMPFGLKTGTAIAQMVIDQVLEPCKSFCFAYKDDIIICSKVSLSNHFEHIKCVIQRLIEYNLKLNNDKIIIAAQRLDFLGFEFSIEGRKPTSYALEAIDAIPAPKTLKSLRRLLGKINFYREFLYKISELELPLLNLLKKYTKFIWDENCEISLQKIKEQFKQVCRLKLPDFSKEFILHSDASHDTNAAVLMQQENDNSLRPIAFYSKRNPHRSTYCPAVLLELRGIVEAMQKFRTWLIGGFTRIYTDHKPLKNLLLRNNDSKLYHYIEILSEYAYEIEFLPGSKNLVADCLSRTHLKRIDCPQNIIITNPPINDDIIITENYNDNVNSTEVNTTSLSLTEKNDTLNIPINTKENITNEEPTSEEKLHLFQYFHDNFGHPCYERIKPLIKKRRSWKNLSKDLKQYLSKCNVCLQRNEIHATKIPNSTISSARPLESMNVDLLGPFPQSDEGYKFILGIIDINTRYAIMEPIRSSMSHDILSPLEKSLFFRYGSPIELRVDNASYFRSSLFKTIKKLYGTEINYGTAYLHESSAPIERMFRTLQNTISKLPHKSYHSWHNLVPKATFFYNCTIHSTLKCSPYKLWHGYEPIFKYDIQNCKEKLDYIIDKDLSEHERQASWKLPQMMSDAIRQEANVPTPKRMNNTTTIIQNKKLSQLIPGTKVLVKIPQVNKTDEIGKFHMKYESGYVVIKRENNSFLVRKHNRGRCRKVHVNFLKIDTSEDNNKDATTNNEENINN